jgi:hypothetical protein
MLFLLFIIFTDFFHLVCDDNFTRNLLLFSPSPSCSEGAHGRENLKFWTNNKKRNLDKYHPKMAGVEEYHSKFVFSGNYHDRDIYHQMQSQISSKRERAFQNGNIAPTFFFEPILPLTRFIVSPLTLHPAAFFCYY